VTGELWLLNLTRLLLFGLIFCLVFNVYVFLNDKKILQIMKQKKLLGLMPVLRIRIRDPDPPDPHVFGPPGYGSGSGSFYHKSLDL
jgi:hypothetical protein